MDEMASQQDESGMMWGDMVGAIATSQLYGDLIIQIIVRLPIKSLLRFKSVCRAWYTLLNSPAFIQHHTHITKSSAVTANLLSLLVYTKKNRQNNQIFSLLCGNGNPVKKNMKLPIEGDFDNFQVAGSINGLVVCLSLCINARSIVLWNPATRKHSRIPDPQLLLESKERVALGFAYDEKKNCYKVVRILFFEDQLSKVPPVARIEIYSTGTNTWRTTESIEFPWLYNPIDGGAVVSGVPYWYAVNLPNLEADFEQLIVWFDTSADTFRFRLLQPHETNGGCLVSLKAMGEHPVLMYMEYPCDDLEWKDIRKLAKFDDGGKDSFRIDKFIVERRRTWKRILGFWRNGEIIASNHDSTICLYGKQETKHLASYESFVIPEVYYYNESLVWPSTLA